MCFSHVVWAPHQVQGSAIRDVFNDGSLIIISGNKNEVYIPNNDTHMILLEISEGNFLVEFDASGGEYFQRLKDMRVMHNYKFDTDWHVENGIVQVSEDSLFMFRLVFF